MNKRTALLIMAMLSMPAAVIAGANDTNLNVDNPSISWDTDILDDPTDETSSTDYISPLQAGGRCTKVFTVNVMFQVSQQDDDSDAFIEDTKGNEGFGASDMDQFPDVIEYLNDADLADGTYGDAADLAGIQNVTSYFIVDETKINTTTRAYAQAGGTGEPLALSDDPEELVTTLEDVFNQILSVSTTFVSASVPVNAFNRAEVIDNVYLALFKADADGKAFWSGNVKKLKFDDVGDGSGDRQLVDVDGDYAVAADGRIKYEALTFWTDAATLPDPDEDQNEVDGKDGRATTRGGAGQKIPGLRTDGPDGPGFTNAYSGGRQLFFDDADDYDGDTDLLEPLNVDDATAGELQSVLGAADLTEAKGLLAYARGLDVNDDDGDGEYGEASAWFSGDPLHSRPLPINYGAVDGYSEDNQKIFIAYGSNDGFMHFVRNTDSDGDESGVEEWAFMPQEVMGELSTLRSNAAGSGHPYLLDGAPSAYVEGRFIDREIDGEDVFLYFGLRRGGKAYYALDISDPEAPELLWKITKSGDFSELGMTFSDPVVGLTSDGSGGTKPIVIFGGGYDANKDDRSGIGTNDTEGNAIYVVDGESGDLIWKAVDGTGTSTDTVFYHSGLDNSIPSDVAAFDSDGDLITDRIYVGDTGGRVWRADIGAADTSDWKLTMLADVGRYYDSSSKSSDRRFFHAPDVVQHIDGAGPFDAVVIGSGDRPDPLAVAGAVDNYMYMIKDRNTGSGAGADGDSMDHSEFGDITNTCLQAGTECSADLSSGWRMGLTASGEMSLASPLTIGSTSYFTTYLPPGTSDEGTCGPDEGSGRLYAVRLDNGEAVRNYDTTTEEFERYDELDSKGIPSEAISLPPDGILKPDLSIEKTDTTTRLRTYWLEVEDDTL